MTENYQDRIVALLRELGETNASLAKGVGRGKATIGRYLSKSENRTHPSIDELTDIAVYLGVQPHWLCFGVGDKYTEKQIVNNMVAAGAATVNIYNRADIAELLSTGSTRIIGTMPVPKEHSDCFGVVYPVQGTISHSWDCAALIVRNREWANDDLVLARIGNNPTPDFFTLVRIADTVHVWYGDDTSKNAMHTITESEIDVLGVACWGVWSKRT
ncbi:helix-turn-helix domain-containing protein [Vibrio coralliirubri]|uniref:helix-turn-helix domain-containing protein n=1 Tax=Vibrio coralliirubri TaxID=1516159 RepID=UPI000A3C06A2|nr:helix-turn-helix transcriptional regulator [Vibrio coralliirubri]